ncbi:hypothetical protein HOLleu_43710 [Holothuria leucospilota]|uniref:Uncharacterized protein n=1 Tax=Holothuria leucospilota TaxID=206669 RepID=A0A9Q1BBE7_HOLLE|nr:hypothetical protein HOLleu_43710 [Holothuria leucospilota]
MSLLIRHVIPSLKLGRVIDEHSLKVVWKAKVKQPDAASGPSFLGKGRWHHRLILVALAGLPSLHIKVWQGPNRKSIASWQGYYWSFRLPIKVNVVKSKKKWIT